MRRLGNRCFASAGRRQIARVLRAGAREAGVECDRAAIGTVGTHPIPVVVETEIRERGLGLGRVRIELERTVGFGERQQPRFLMRDGPEKALRDQPAGQSRVRPDVVGIDCERTPERLDGAAIGRRLAQVVQSLVVRLVGLRRRRPGPAQTAALGRRQHGTDAGGDGLGDLGLQRERVAERSFELLRPDLRVGGGGNQPGVDAHAIG